MNYLTSSATLPHETTVPNRYESADIVGVLHDHGAIISLNCFIIKYEQGTPSREMQAEWKTCAPEPNGASTTYDCQEKVPGWGLVDFQVTFQGLDDGFFCLTHAPLGTKMQDTCRLDVDATTGERTLRETFLVRGSVFFFPFIRRSVHKAHDGRHLKILSRIDKADGSRFA